MCKDHHLLQREEISRQIQLYSPAIYPHLIPASWEFNYFRCFNQHTHAIQLHSCRVYVSPLEFPINHARSITQLLIQDLFSELIERRTPERFCKKIATIIFVGLCSTRRLTALMWLVMKNKCVWRYRVLFPLLDFLFCSRSTAIKSLTP